MVKFTAGPVNDPRPPEVARRAPPRDSPARNRDPAPLHQTRRSLPIARLRARETVMGPIRQRRAAADVREGTWRVLRVVQEGGPMDLTALADLACLRLPSQTRMVRPMLRDGLIARPPRPRTGGG